MHRTTRLRILFPAMLALTAVTPPAKAPASDDPQGTVVAMADETPPPPTPATPPRAARAPRAPHTPAPAEVAAPAAPPEAELAPEAPGVQVRSRPRGRFGFGFDCTDCRDVNQSPDSLPIWTFKTRPRVYSVEPGSPAARAGFRRGDVITHIDGASILSSEGGRRFGATLPGQTVRWTVLRDGETRELEATAIEWRTDRVVIRDLSRDLQRLDKLSDDELRRQLRELNRQMEQLRQEQRRARVQVNRTLRYAGVIGDAQIEVRGAPVQISESNERDRLVINTGESVVVIQLAEMTPKKKSPPK